MNRPGDFKPRTITKLRQHAGEQCSAPGCTTMTAGPQMTGEAAHILPASPGGPRSQFVPTGTSAAHLANYDNGIWLCETHASLIDKGKGVDFPPYVLHAWKELHETTVKLLSGNAARRVGWIHSLDIQHTLKDAEFITPGHYLFGPANLLLGRSPSGKSAMLNLLTAASRFDVSRYQYTGDFEYEVKWFDPQLQSMECRLRTGEAFFRLAGESWSPVPVAAPITVRMEHHGPTQTPEEIGERLEMHVSDVEALLPELGKLAHNGEPVGPFESACLKGSGREPFVKLRGGPELPLPAISGGEQDALALEISLARALAYGDSRPVALILDPLPTILQQYLPGYLLAFLEGNPGRVQIFATAHSAPKSLDLAGWQIIDLDDRRTRAGVP